MSQISILNHRGSKTPQDNHIMPTILNYIEVYWSAKLFSWVKPLYALDYCFYDKNTFNSFPHMDFTLITENQNDPEVESNPILGLYRYKNENWNRNTKEMKFIIHMEKKKKEQDSRVSMSLNLHLSPRDWTTSLNRSLGLAENPTLQKSRWGKRGNSLVFDGFRWVIENFECIFFSESFTIFFPLASQIKSWPRFMSDVWRERKSWEARRRAEQGYSLVYAHMRHVLFLCRFAPPIRHSRLF